MRDNPELAIFLTSRSVSRSAGSASEGFSLGNVVGTQLAGVVVGQLDVKLDPQ